MPRMNDDTVGPRSDEDSTALVSVVRIVWRERRRVALTVVAVLLGLLVAGPVMLWMQPAERTASLPFRLVFDSAEHGKYPNGSTFSRSDLISNAVITEVYESNDLKRYLSFDSFRRGMFVLATSTDIVLLDLQYRAKLSETPLPAPERSRLETEYRQKRESMPTPQLSLQLVLPTTVATLPDLVMQKVLADTLAAWAQQVARDKGALSYSTAILTPAAVSAPALASPTTFVRYDHLRRSAARVIQQIDRLSALPGATTVRVGPDRWTLLDLKVRVEDLLRFDVLPAMARGLATTQTSQESTANAAYLRDRLGELHRALDVAMGRREQVQQALAAFATGSDGPDFRRAQGNVSAGDARLPDSFLDSVVALAGRSGAVDYRKSLTEQELSFGAQALAIQEDIAFYTDTSRQSSSVSGRQVSVLPRDEMETAFQGSQALLLEVLEMANELYDKISELNLGAQVHLYEVTGPTSVATVRALTERWLLNVGAFLLFVTAIVAAAFFVALRMVRRPVSS